MICGVLHFNITLFALVGDAAFEVANVLQGVIELCVLHESHEPHGDAKEGAALGH